MSDAIRNACIACLDRFMAAVNAYDVAAMEAEMHFPHVRFAGGTIVTYPASGGNPLDLFERLRREDDWHHSTWNTRRMVQHDATKAHMAVNYTRRRADGSVIGVYDSLYVLALKDGRWGVQLRSSFGP
ncbi:MAG: hypothetical protein JNM90_03530 [Burkholderiales bacterium]|nr:hypothetical protein [Burkholderiales bacterium]